VKITAAEPKLLWEKLYIKKAGITASSLNR